VNFLARIQPFPRKLFLAR